MQVLMLLLIAGLLSGCQPQPLYLPRIEVVPGVIGFGESFSVRVLGAEYGDYRFMGATRQTDAHLGQVIPVHQEGRSDENSARCIIQWAMYLLTWYEKGISRMPEQRTEATLMSDILAHNERFVAEREGPISKSPAKRIALFTCMDTRLVEFLEPAMGLGRGDAKVIKNAGNTIIDPGGGVVRSLVVAVYALGCEEIFVIGHRDCGMSQIDDRELEQRMLSRGVPKEAIAALQPDLKEWLGSFHDPYGNVTKVVQTLRDSPLIPKDVPVHGMMFDPTHGRLELLVNGYSQA